MLSSIKINHRKKEAAEGGEKLLFMWQAHYVLEYFPLKEKKTTGADASERNTSCLLNSFCALAELTVLLE